MNGLQEEKKAFTTLSLQHIILNDLSDFRDTEESETTLYLHRKLFKKLCSYVSEQPTDDGFINRLKVSHTDLWDIRPSLAMSCSALTQLLYVRNPLFLYRKKQPLTFGDST